METAAKTLIMVLVVVPWLIIVPPLVLLGLSLLDHGDPANPHEVITAREIWQEGLKPNLLPLAIGAYAYVLFIVYVFVASRKPA